MKDLLGAHISIAGGLEMAIERASLLGINCMQIFTKSNRSWRSKPLEAEKIELFKKQLCLSSIKEIGRAHV